ncbi:HD-GYP domain-containing protein [Capillibacterium thermochitinicola]|uniref:HD-GYP domain-containing protein n=1 Tax=Capillibacterium thermochitinicola TaxID=2699427 RepID=A0A8J6HTC6_9FIRM|nr:HD-GYP domain-containing protein [Capillibacterium thermochitinicola]MBA2133851.1 HD-GYP domain-containing protein [Capillibacterium thermochitinicola]
MKKKPLVLGLVAVPIVYLAGAYYLYRKILFPILTRKEFLTYIFVVVSIFLLLLSYSFYYLFTFRQQLREHKNRQKKSFSQLKKANEGALKALLHALECRDHDTWDHSTRVAAYATALAEQMGLSQSELKKIALAGYLHDIGKIGVPDRILLKKTKLLPEEWEMIKRHPELGYDIIHELDFLNDAADIILLHHERYDGTGYPLGLKGEKIPLLARIFAVADALDAMTSERPYRAARSMEEAFTEVHSLAGVQFCPECVKALEELGIEKLSRIQQRVKNQEIMKFRLEDLVLCSDFY